VNRRIKMAGVAGWLLVVAWIGAQADTLDVYLLRHAQTMANVTREYTEENQRTFSPLGEAQLAEIADKLADYDFDAIIVSPAYRVLHTVLPHLQARGMQAEIWPELYECCWDRDTVEEEPELTQGKRIELEEAIASYFRFRDDEAVYMFDVDTPARGDLMVKRAVEMIESRFGGAEKKVLVVSHYHTGSRLLRALLGEAAPRTIRPANARLSHVRQDADGRFQLLMLNDVEMGMGE